MCASENRPCWRSASSHVGQRRQRVAGLERRPEAGEVVPEEEQRAPAGSRRSAAPSWRHGSRDAAECVRPGRDRRLDQAAAATARAAGPANATGARVRNDAPTSRPRRIARCLPNSSASMSIVRMIATRWPVCHTPPRVVTHHICVPKPSSSTIPNRSRSRRDADPARDPPARAAAPIAARTALIPDSQLVGRPRRRRGRRAASGRSPGTGRTGRRCGRLGRRSRRTGRAAGRSTPGRGGTRRRGRRSRRGRPRTPGSRTSTRRTRRTAMPMPTSGRDGDGGPGRCGRSRRGE